MIRSVIMSARAHQQASVCSFTCNLRKLTFFFPPKTETFHKDSFISTQIENRETPSNAHLLYYFSGEHGKYVSEHKEMTDFRLNPFPCLDWKCVKCVQVFILPCLCKCAHALPCTHWPSARFLLCLLSLIGQWHYVCVLVKTDRGLDVWVGQWVWLSGPL